MKWISGRHKTQYKIFPFIILKFNKRFLFDMLLINYPKGSSIPLHNDPEVRWRLNIELSKPKSGGYLMVEEKAVIWSWKRILLLDPQYYHQVTKIEEGRRLIFSIGIGK